MAKRTSKSAKSTKSPVGYRRATKPELATLGVSPKSERYVPANVKRVTAKTHSISKRQAVQWKLGTTLEKAAQQRASGERVYRSKKAQAAAEKQKISQYNPFSKRGKAADKKEAARAAGEAANLSKIIPIVSEFQKLRKGPKSGEFVGQTRRLQYKGRDFRSEYQDLREMWFRGVTLSWDEYKALEDMMRAVGDKALKQFEKSERKNKSEDETDLAA